MQEDEALNMASEFFEVIKKVTEGLNSSMDSEEEIMFDRVKEHVVPLLDEFEKDILIQSISALVVGFFDEKLKEINQQVVMQSMMLVKEAEEEDNDE